MVILLDSEDIMGVVCQCFKKVACWGIDGDSEVHMMENLSVIDYGKFKKALKHLELQYKNYETLDPGLPKLIHEAVVESVIQRFETCYDTLWKILKRYLREELGIPDVPNSPRKILRLAAENELFASSTDRWMEYAQARVNTSHDYSLKKAQDALKLMLAFINDSRLLFQTMSGEKWK